MKRAKLHFLALLPVALLIGSCVGTEAPTSVGENVQLDIPINPALIPSPADGGAAPINRIRARVARVADNVVLGETTIDVDPTADEWEILLEATVGQDGTEVTIYVYLINVTAEVETVEFSGLLGPVTITATEPFETADIPIIRGPIENFFVTGVTITTAPSPMVEGTTETFTADATTSSANAPTVFWTVLDSAVLSSSGADVTALAPGVGRIVASAGTSTDTASVTVVPAPADVLVSPDTAFVIGAGAQATFTAAVVDARGDTIVGDTVVWSSGTPTVITSLGGGTFEAAATGDGLVQAAAGSDPTVVGTAVMSVADSPADVQVTKSASASAALVADTIDFEITVTNASQDVLVGIAVSDSLPTGFTLESSTPAGTFDAPTGTWTWTLDTLAVAQSTTIDVRASVDAGVGTQTLTNVALVAPPPGYADPAPADNRATVAVDVTDTAPDAPDVAVTLAAADSTPAEGDTIAVTVQIDNLDVAGAVDVTNVVVGLAAVPDVELVDGQGTQGTFDPQTDLWSVGTVPVGQGATLTLGVEIPVGTTGQSIVGTAFVQAIDQTQTNLTNDTATVQLDVSDREVDVAVLKTIDVAQPLEDTDVVFTVSVVNNGPGVVTDVVVFDTLDSSSFTGAAHVVSTGALVDDSLWTIPSLDQGDTATWSTTTRVATGVAGGSASNTAVLRALAQNDTLAANDTAVVNVNFPVSGVPVVQITAPPDGTVYDPGDLATFSATANDPEDGDLTASIQWASNLDGNLAVGGNFETDQLRTGLHTISATATDQQSVMGADTIVITVALITTPTTLNVPFGGTASLPITLSEPAQAGGLTLDVVANDPQITTPTASTVFIAGGASATNSTLQGLAPGTTDVTVSNAQFGSSTTSVSVTAELDIIQTSVEVPQTFPQTMTIQLESQGAAIPAPAGGLDVTLTSLDATCASAQATATIPAGLVSQTATVSYGGSATLPCSTYVRTTAPSITPDSVLVNVSVTPSFTVPTATIGGGLQNGTFQTVLGTSNHGGTTVRLVSEDPSIMLVAPNNSTPGTAFIDVDVVAGQNRAFYWVQGVEGTTGTSSLVASAPGFATDSALITIVQPGLDLSGLNTTTTTFSPDDAFTVRLGIPNAQQTGLAGIQAARAGGPTFTATVTSSAPAIGDLITTTDTDSPVTVQIAPVASSSPGSVASGGVAFEPLTVGQTTVTATIPGFVQTANGSHDVTVSAPGITIGDITVGAGLQYGTFFATLGASDHGGVTLRLESEDPSVMLVSPNSATAGTAFIDVVLPDGQSRASYFVHGLEGQTGVVPLNVSAPGFTPNSSDVTVVQAGYEIVALNTNTTSFSPDDAFYVRAGVPNGQQTGLSINQAVRIGGQTLAVDVASSLPAVGDLITTPDSDSPVALTIVPGAFNTGTSVAGGGVAFEPISAGSTVVTATIDGLIQTSNAIRTVTITAPGITVPSTTVGAGLQYGLFQATLGATDHPGVTVTLASADPSVMLVSPDAQTAGTASFEVDVPTGQNRVRFYVHGVEGQDAAAALNVTAPGFTAGSSNITVVPPGIEIVGLGLTQTTFSPNDAFTARIGVPNAANTGLSITQAVRIGGNAVTAAFNSSNVGAGILETSEGQSRNVTATIAPGQSNTPSNLAAGGVEFDPLGVGSTDISVTATGYIAQASATRTVNVSAPGITVPTATVGAGLMHGTFFATLGATQHGGRTVTITSSNPGVLLVSPDNQTAGTASIDVVVPNGQTRANFFVHGVDGATGTVSITAEASGFTDGTNAASVVQPALDLVSLNSQYSAGANDDAFWVRLGTPTTNETGISSEQAIRIGGSGFTATITTDDVAVAQLATSTTSGASIQLTISAGQSRTPTSVAAGGVSIDPVAVGSALIQATITGVITTDNGARTVTINP